MLEIRNVTKVYRTKGGQDVKALDNVSIRFEETGLVFLLGKSGSGKSTLLNVAGGLDTPTSGEVIVMGKSSNDFSGSDFDSYRNTFIGFIFQEYNVLNEFNVEDNVALALELQGKPKDKERIYEILKAVELDSFAKRRPNTLSGGQKQRIAIARALVKEPQIIMADEPTGALDSATGKQVFDTLKKLSETRLVIVVSHDREFAEIYGDRIVELKDGQIISDVKKVKTPPQELGKNLTQIGENTLSITSGTELTEADMKAIKAFVAASEGNVIISKGEKEIAGFKKANRIDEGGAREQFHDTDDSALVIREYQKGDAKFIRSRLPGLKALKIGASGLKIKPFRLVLTILLSIFAFVMFGLFSTMMFYDNDAVMTNTFMESDLQYLTLSKMYWANVQYSYDDYSYEYDTRYEAKFTPDEVKKFGNNALGAYDLNTSANNLMLNKEGSYYYSNGFKMVAFVPESHPLRNNVIAGKYPAASDEICVSDYFLESARNGTFTNPETNKAVPINSASDLIGQKLNISGKLFKVSGIFSAGTIPSKYDDLKTATSTTGFDMTYYQFQSFIEEGLHSLVFVGENFEKDYPEFLTNWWDREQYFTYTQYQYILCKDEESSYLWTSQFAIYDTEKPHYELTYLKGNTLSGNRIAVNLNTIQNMLYNREEFSSLEWEEQEKIYHAFDAVNRGVVYIQVEEEEDGNTYWYTEERPATEEEVAEAKKFIGEILSQYTLSAKFYEERYDQFGSSKSFFDDVEVVAYYVTENDSGVYCSQSFFDRLSFSKQTEVITTKYEKEKDATYQYVFLPLEKSETAFTSLLNSMKRNLQTDVEYYIENSLFETVSYVNDMIEEMSLVFLIIGIVLAVFAALLLFNFITLSISNKKKDIGILRAVGARGIDVFKIFFSESGIIVGLCLILALIGTAVATTVINGVLKTQIGLDVTLFIFGVLPVVLMTGIAIVVALISTFLPVYFAARKKPVDSIRAL